MTSKAADDLEAVRTIVESLKQFDGKEQERIIRWAREKLGLDVQPVANAINPSSKIQVGVTSVASVSDVPARSKDIRAFVNAKNPQSENQFAATVAYFYRFEAPEIERKTDIGADDVQEATRKVGRDRIKNPSQTLVNAHAQGLFDKAGRGRYTISTVGENLVAMALPQDSARPARKSQRQKKKIVTKKKK